MVLTGIGNCKSGPFKLPIASGKTTRIGMKDKLGHFAKSGPTEKLPECKICMSCCPSGLQSSDITNCLRIPQCLDGSLDQT